MSVSEELKHSWLSSCRSKKALNLLAAAHLMTAEQMIFELKLTPKSTASIKKRSGLDFRRFGAADDPWRSHDRLAPPRTESWEKWLV